MVNLNIYWYVYRLAFVAKTKQSFKDQKSIKVLSIINISYRYSYNKQMDDDVPVYVV